MTSSARPSQTPTGTHELVRRWEPEHDVRAEMVLCHGIAEHSGRYEAVGQQFADAGISVTAYDQIGFGASGGRRAWVDQWSDVLDQIQAHISHAKESGKPVILLGHSNGGLFALEYALSERPAPNLLVLSAPLLFGGAAWMRVLAPVLSAIAPKLEVPNGLDGSQLSRDPAVGEAYFADPLTYPKTTTRYGAEMYSAMDRVRGSLNRLSIPTLVIHGAADTIVPPQSTAVLGEIDGVDRKLYPALRHEMFNEPEGAEIVGDVISWIESHLS